jgi:2-amino-4-hydroxy-6-hydroxymethyldihydropteridine diphosphokinase
MAEALIALGGNVGNVRDTIDRAIAAFCDGAAVRLLARSPDYRTPPIGVTDQPPFINCAIVAATELPPPALLARAQSVEAQFGRNRSQEQHWGPRTLDIDLIAYDDLAMNTSELTCRIRGRWSAPSCCCRSLTSCPSGASQGVRIKNALARVDQTGIEKLPPR